MIKNSISKILLLFLCATATVAIYFGVWWTSLGGYEKAEHWIKPVYEVKLQRATEIKRTKIILAGGSSTLFGFDSRLLTKEIGRPFINLGGHAALSLKFIADKILLVANEGDAVILPLEYSYYQSSENPSDWQMNNMQSWGSDYIKNLSAYETLKFARHADFKGIATRLLSKSKEALPTTAETISINDIQKFAELTKWQGYSFTSLNYYGDIQPNLPITELIQEEANKGISYIKTPLLTQSFIQDATDLKVKLAKRGVELYFTWPPTIKNISFDLDNSPYHKRAIELKNNMTVAGFRFICEPESFNMERSYFFDSIYHLNLKGSILRTLKLSECIKSEIYGEKSQDINYYKKLDYIYELKIKAPNSNILKRISDLESLKGALQQYHTVNGKYPVTEVWDGLYSNWGKSTQNWIADLAPKYIKTLPRDPRNNTNGGEQYMYRSDGIDYKLIAHNIIEDCKFVQDGRSELIDPARNCWAYGFWTKGAEVW